MCDFLVNLDDYFAVVCTSFHESYGFHQICSLYIKLPKVCKVPPSLDPLISSLETPPTPSAYIWIIPVFDFVDL